MRITFSQNEFDKLIRTVLEAEGIITDTQGTNIKIQDYSLDEFLVITKGE